MSASEILIQQLIIGLSNGLIIALIALGYTMVYGIIELINFAHGDLFMLGCFLALTLVGTLGLQELAADGNAPWQALTLMLLAVPIFCGSLNYLVDRFAYRPLRNAPRLAPLVSAIGVSFIFLNLGLFWGGAPLEVFNYGRSAAAPKDFPELFTVENLLGDSNIFLTSKDLLVACTVVPLLLLLTVVVRYTRLGKAMRAVAQDQTAARLMGIDVDRIISATFIIGGAMAGVAAVIYSTYNNTVFFQMGYRVGMDAFTAAVLGGIGSLAGAVSGGVLIGIVRALSDQYIEARWTNVVVFGILILTLIFRPGGLFRPPTREKV